MVGLVRRVGRFGAVARLAWSKRALLRQALERLGVPDVPGPTRANPSKARIYLPRVAIVEVARQAGYMEYSTCAAADFLDPRFIAACATIGFEHRFHRKLWEFVFVMHHLDRAGMLAAGRRGIGFGVGTEPLPAAFAARGAAILATDAPAEIGIAAGWAASNQLASGKQTLRRDHLCDPATFERLVDFALVDMNQIGGELTGFDFAWSACCLEHLGSLRAGLDFVAHTVEQVLRPGGVAVHTTELNLSSDDATVEQGGTVLYRRRDLEAFIGRMREAGHEVMGLRIAPDTHFLDGWVDMPPYSDDAHLKLALEGFTSTSVGLVIRRGPG